MSGPFLALRGLDAYPKQDTLRQALLRATGRDRRAFVYLWLTEGCPVGMEPWIYQWFREKVAKVTGIECKSVSLAGSYRLGYSLKPDKYGDGVRPTSDMDGLIVSSQLFDRVLPEARDVARKHRPDLVSNVEKCAKLNFVKTGYIEPEYRSHLVQSMHYCYWHLSKPPFNLKFDVAHSNFFIYRDWDSAVRRNIGFLCELRRKLKKKDAHRGA